MPAPKIDPPGQMEDHRGKVEICFTNPSLNQKICVVVPEHAAARVGGQMSKDGVTGTIESVTPVPADTPVEGVITE